MTPRLSLIHLLRDVPSRLLVKAGEVADLDEEQYPPLGGLTTSGDRDCRLGLRDSLCTRFSTQGRRAPAVFQYGEDYEIRYIKTRRKVVLFGKRRGKKWF